MKKTKWILSLGTVAAIASPIAVVVSCGSSSNSATTKFTKEQTDTINAGIKKIVDGANGLDYIKGYTFTAKENGDLIAHVNGGNKDITVNTSADKGDRKFMLELGVRNYTVPGEDLITSASTNDKIVYVDSFDAGDQHNVEVAVKAQTDKTKDGIKDEWKPLYDFVVKNWNK